MKAYPCLSEAGPACIFRLADTSTEDLAVDCIVHQESGGIALEVGDIPNGEGRPVFIEWHNSALRIHVWKDATNESPTDTVEVPLDF